MKFTTIASALALAAAAFASPVLEAREEWSPPIITPNANTVWKSGERAIVSWNNTYAPVNITGGGIGRIILRFGEVETPVLLAWDFNIRDNRTEIIVPNVYSGDDYSIVLFGDSTNWSEQFTINGPDGE